mmetsp:Transcript_23322/g.51518  ORF Transcript_23322/g.51518 Transcript_23322/m.51518 type:complete len:239 (-) Transcript_23322:84-800(-)
MASAASRLACGLAGLMVLCVVLLPSGGAFVAGGAPRAPATTPAGQVDVPAAEVFAELRGSATVPVAEGVASTLHSALRSSLALLAALLVVLVPVADAQAARSGGRIGGSAASRPAARPAPPRAAPRAAEPRVENKTTIVNKTVIVAPPPPAVIAPAPVVSPYGMGMGMMSPVVVAPPPTIGDIVVGAAIGSAINSAMPHPPSGTDRMLENQIRQDERQMDRQASQIEDMKRELAELKK